jgi:hypothetical protein
MSLSIRSLAAFAASLTLMAAVVACDSDEETTTVTAANPPAEEPPAAAEEEEESESLPTETQAMALDEGESQIPATITVPTGCTTLNDSPTAIRVDHGDMGELFGVQVKEGNEFNMNLSEFAGDLRENRYGTTNDILEETDELLLWTATTDGRTSHKFRLLVELAGKTWVCEAGNYGGWSREQVDRQIEACRTLAAKE